MQVVGIVPDGLDGTNLHLGHDYLLTDSNQLVSTNSAHSHSPSPPGGGSPGGSPGGGSHGGPHSPPPPPPSTGSPASTLVGSSSGLEINLIWDSSVTKSANWSAIEAAVVAAAQLYTQDYSNHVVLNIAVGLGEIGGSSMSSSALGESESIRYIANYSTVQGALNTADAGLVADGLLSSGAISANSPPTNANFFVTSAEAKALGLVGSSTAIDGYIGISASSSVYFAANGGTIGTTQYDAVGIATHEISEVMGRIGLVGTSLGPYSNVYTPLDLFRYTSSGVRDLTPTAGYFSTNGGVSNLSTYNNPNNGGDATDWASSVVNDAYDAFGTPGVITTVSSTDILENAVLGYNLTAGTLPPTVSA